MKKLVLSAIVIAAILPCFCAGIDTDQRIREDRRNALLEQRFQRWCYLNGYDYAAMSEYHKDAVFCDVWSESEDYMSACDSIDKVLSISRDINKGM